MVDNQGKISIIRRVLIGLGAIGVREAWIMPDTHSLGERALEGLSQVAGSLPDVRVLDMPVTGQSEDSELAAKLLRERQVGCIVILGGDGTVRMASKGCGEVPCLPISTGTNNVLPSFVEGTVAGLAAGAVACGQVPLDAVAVRHKWLEVFVDGASRDRALIDVAALAGQFVGSRAVWNVNDLKQVVVTRADPATIGISAIVGMVRPVAIDEALGIALSLSSENDARRLLCAIGPGTIAEVGISAVHVLRVDEVFDLTYERPLVLALDGEREITLYEGSTASLKLRADGPWIIDTRRVMAEITARRLLHL